MNCLGRVWMEKKSRLAGLSPEFRDSSVRKFDKQESLLQIPSLIDRKNSYDFIEIVQTV